MKERISRCISRTRSHTSTSVRVVVRSQGIPEISKISRKESCFGPCPFPTANMLAQSEILTNLSHPPTSATLTLRIIKSFEYRTERSLILHNVNLETITVGQLKEIARESIQHPVHHFTILNIVFVVSSSDTTRVEALSYGQTRSDNCFLRRFVVEHSRRYSEIIHKSTRGKGGLAQMLLYTMS